MSLVAYADDGIMMADAYLKRNYSALSEKIVSQKDEYSYAIDDNGKIFAYDIRKNGSLSGIYGFECYVVKFALSSVDTLHQKEQEDALRDLCVHLKEQMSAVKAYYNVRLPSHISDLIRVFNEVFDGSKIYFCGGTVEYVQTADAVREFEKHPDLKLFYADRDYLKEHSKVLIDLAHESFKSYQGQYHISPMTSDSAGSIYADWIRNSISEMSDDEILIAEVDGEIAGYVTFRRSERAIEGILSSVDPAFRKHSVYKSLISYLTYEAQKNGSFFYTSTQFDNFIVQGAWISLGLKPFASIYNHHLNFLN